MYYTTREICILGVPQADYALAWRSPSRYIFARYGPRFRNSPEESIVLVLQEYIPYFT
jgi:hypothetical protein